MNYYRTCKNTIFSVFKKVTVGARILLVRDTQVLLVKHTYMPGWFTIGGAVEVGESPMEAVCRESREEVGAIFKKKPTIFSIYLSNFEKRDDYIVLFTSNEFEQEEVSSPEILEKKWFPLTQLPPDITPATERRIHEYLGKTDISDRW